MGITQLESSNGFSLDARAPRWDKIAVDYANAIFGSDTVTGILGRYKRSHVTLENLKEDIMQYDVKYNSRPHNDLIYIAALQSVREAFVPQVPLTPLTMGAVTTSTSIPKDKSPGLPWKERGFKTKQEVWEDEAAMAEIRSEWMRIGRGYTVVLPDCLTYARAQVTTKDKNKIRATWGYPTSVFTEEARFVYPYLDFLKKRIDDYPLAYGIEMANGGMGYINNMFCRSEPGVRVGMLDWKRFDKHVPAWLIRDAFAILEECFEKDRVIDSEGIYWPVNPEITTARWKKMVRYFINTPFRLPNGERYRKDGGVPSGSGWTNIIDSIVNAICTRYCVYHTTGFFPHYDMYMGDDGVIFSHHPLALDSIADVAQATFGFVLNLDKSYVTFNPDNIQFLGYYNRKGFPFRDQDFLLASFMLPEHVNDPDPYFTAARAVGQMYSTFSGYAAQRWRQLVHRLAQDFKFEPGWFTAYMKKHPNRLKFLRLHGLDATKFPEPDHFPAYAGPMDPPPMPAKRRPVRRFTDPRAFYDRFMDNPLLLMDTDE